MAYLIFKNNCDNITGSLCSIAENQNDLSYLETVENKIIEISSEQFLQIQLNNVIANKYNGEVVTYINTDASFRLKEHLQVYINGLINQFNKILLNNPDSYFKNKAVNYVNLISNYDLDSISYPLNSSFEEYLKNNNQTVLNILQVQ